MIVKFFNNKSDNIYINKTLENETPFDCKIKGEINLTNPEIVLRVDNFNGFNYCYIEDFNRYYYIDSVQIFPNNLYSIRLKVDVLMSFKNSIYGSPGILVRKKENSSYYGQPDTLESSNFTIYNSDTEVKYKNSNILVTLGVEKK